MKRASAHGGGGVRRARRESFREIHVRAVRTRSDHLKDAVDRAYLQKYHTPGSVKYARDLGRAKSRATTTELVPFRETDHA